MVVAKQRNRACISLDEIENRLQACGLAGTVGAHQREDTARGHIERQPTQDLRVRKSLVHIVHVDGRFNHPADVMLSTVRRGGLADALSTPG